MTDSSLNKLLSNTIKLHSRVTVAVIEMFDDLDGYADFPGCVISSLRVTVGFREIYLVSFLNKCSAIAILGGPLMFQDANINGMFGFSDIPAHMSKDTIHTTRLQRVKSIFRRGNRK